jgi:hypothetical protein
VRKEAANRIRDGAVQFGVDSSSTCAYLLRRRGGGDGANAAGELLHVRGVLEELHRRTHLLCDFRRMGSPRVSHIHRREATMVEAERVG